MKGAHLLIFLAISATLNADPIDDFILAEMKRTKSPAIEIGIMRDGKLVKHQCYGKANIELDVPA